MKTKRVARGASTGIEAIDYTVINAGLEKNLDLAWTAKSQMSLKRAVGPKNYRKIEEIISFASNQEAWLNSNNLSAAADTVAGKLSQCYPGLSPTAGFKIVNQSAYGWR